MTRKINRQGGGCRCIQMAYARYPIMHFSINARAASNRIYRFRSRSDSKATGYGPWRHGHRHIDNWTKLPKINRNNQFMQQQQQQKTFDWQCRRASCCCCCCCRQPKMKMNFSAENKRKPTVEKHWNDVDADVDNCHDDGGEFAFCIETTRPPQFNFSFQLGHFELICASIIEPSVYANARMFLK